MERDKKLWGGAYCALYQSKDGLYISVSDGVGYIGEERYGLAELLEVLQEYRNLLKPKPETIKVKCPFCGTKLSYLKVREVEDGRHAVYCEVCGTRGPLGDTPNLAIQGWNKAFKK